MDHAGEVQNLTETRTSAPIGIPIEIHTHDRLLAFTLFDVKEGEPLTLGDEVVVAEGIVLKHHGEYSRKSFGYPTVHFVDVLIGVGAAAGIYAVGVSQGVVATYIWERIRDKVGEIEKLVIGGHKTDPSPEAIEQILRELAEGDRESIDTELSILRRKLDQF